MVRVGPGERRRLRAARGRLPRAHRGRHAGAGRTRRRTGRPSVSVLASERELRELRVAAGRADRRGSWRPPVGRRGATRRPAVAHPRGLRAARGAARTRPRPARWSAPGRSAKPTSTPPIAPSSPRTDRRARPEPDRRERRTRTPARRRLGWHGLAPARQERGGVSVGAEVGQRRSSAACAASLTAAWLGVRQPLGRRAVAARACMPRTTSSLVGPPSAANWPIEARAPDGPAAGPDRLRCGGCGLGAVGHVRSVAANSARSRTPDV